MSPGPEAWHEAGHALAALFLGGVVREVTLESERDGLAGLVPLRRRRQSSSMMFRPLRQLIVLRILILRDVGAR